MPILLEKQRTGTGIREVLGVVCQALDWNASEIHVTSDRFGLTLPSKPPDEDKIKGLSDLLKYVELTSMQLSGDLIADAQAVFEFCHISDLYLVRIFVFDIQWFFGAMGMDVADTFMGVRVGTSKSVPPGNVIFGLSNVPVGPLRTVSRLLQGGVPEV